MSHEVVAALIVQKQKILLRRRSAERQYLPNVWDLFGAHNAIGWFPLAAANR